MKFLQFLNAHKTKITGFMLVVLGSVQANATMLQPILSPKAYAILMTVAGAIVAGLGFINGSKQP